MQETGNYMNGGSKKKNKGDFDPCDVNGESSLICWFDSRYPVFGLESLLGFAIKWAPTL